jgi:hypothetical protein
LNNLGENDETQAVGKAGEEGAKDKDEEPAHKDGLPADNVGEAAHGQDEDADGQDVPCRHPLDYRQLGVKVVGDGWQGDVDTLLVDDGGNDSQTGGPGGPPLMTAALGKG